MSTVEDIVRMRKNGMKRIHVHKRIRIRNLNPNVHAGDLEVHIEQMAEQEDAMSRYEHGQEVA